MEWLYNNLTLWINLLALELGLVGGTLLPVWLISDRKLIIKDIKALFVYQFILLFITIQMTFSSWEFAKYVPVYFGMGVAAPVFAVGMYKLFIASVPNLLQNLLPPWLAKLFAAKQVKQDEQLKVTDNLEGKNNV